MKNRRTALPDWPVSPPRAEPIVESNVAEKINELADRRLGIVRKKSGSFMSDKQMARAAVQGQCLVFRTGVEMPVKGYVVGMDDFHWLIATPSNPREPVMTTLVHKSCPLVSFTPVHLEDEDEDDRRIIQETGLAFWSFCQASGLTRSVTTTLQESSQ